MTKKLLYNALSWVDALPMLRELWREAFGDSDEFIDAFMGCFGGDDYLHTLSCDGRVVAALYALPYGFSTGGEYHRLAYIYAVATRKEFRGQGVMRMLMGLVHDSLKQQGYAAAFLLPSSVALANYYASMGYKPVAARRTEMLVASTPLSSGYSMCRSSALTDEAYNFISRSMASRPCNVVHSRAALNMNVASCCLSGGALYVVTKDDEIVGATFLSLCEEGPLLLDIFFGDKKVKDFIVAQLLKEYSLDNVPLLCTDNEKGDPFAMMLHFCDSVPANVNVQLMLDK